MNGRLSDVFQTGIVLYRLLENGAWPFENSLDFAKTGGTIREFAQCSDEIGIQHLRTLCRQMMSVDPACRPHLLSKVEQEIKSAAAWTG